MLFDSNLKKPEIISSLNSNKKKVPKIKKIKNNMFEARLEQGHVLKKIIEAIKDLVKTVNLDANSSGLSMQAMD